MKTRKFISLALAMLLAAVIFLAACGGDDAGGSRSADSPGGGAAPGEADGNENDQEMPDGRDPAFVSDLGEADFGGHVFHVLGREIAEPWGSWNTFEIYAEQEDGTLINDAVYRRNRILEDRYNFTVAQTRVMDTLIGHIRRTVQAGEDTYDLVLPPSREATTLATEGALADLKQVPNLNLGKGYWNPNIEQYLAINNKVFYATGDINIMDKQATHVLYFNKETAADLGLENPYNLVREGKWTMDVFNEMLRDVSRDLNGDGRFDHNDQFGLLIADWGLRVFNYFAGEPVVSKTAAGGLDITFNNERTISAIDKAIGILSHNQAYVFNDWLLGQNMFESGQALFYSEVMDKTGQLRNMEIPFGVLPPPKLDETQRQYHTMISDVAQFFCILEINENKPRSGFILEALAEASTDTLKNAYYDMNLTVKFVRDEDSVEMIELIMQGIVFDVALIYDLGNINAIVANSIRRGQNSFVSDFERNEERARATLERFVEAFE
jgi:hypothetical protein